MASEAEQRAMRERAQVDVDDSARRAAEAPVATLEEVRNYVYAG